MKKFYCDRCKCETDTLCEARMPYKVEKFGDKYSVCSKEIEVCKSCYDFITQAEIRYNNLLAHQRVAFFNTLMLYSPEKGGVE